MLPEITANGVDLVALRNQAVPPQTSSSIHAKNRNETKTDPASAVRCEPISTGEGEFARHWRVTLAQTTTTTTSPSCHVAAKLES